MYDCSVDMVHLAGQFTPPIPHPNIFPSGYVCLSLLTSGWKPAITLKQLLLGIQQLLDEPNLKSPANQDMYVLYRYSSGHGVG